MSKKIVEDIIESTIDDKRELLRKEINSKYGEVLVNASKIANRERKIVSVSPLIDYHIGGGIPEGSWVLLSGLPKAGKAQPTDSIIYTPDGPICIGNIKAGDVVCTPNGKTAKVIKVYPQGKKDIFELTFSDNTKAQCSLEHLWQVFRNDSKHKSTILPLTAFKDDLYYPDRPKWFITTTKPVSFNKQKITVDPYLLGLLLGDGSFRNKRIGFTNIDNQLVSEMNDILKKYNCYLRNVKGTCSYRIQTNNIKHNVLKCKIWKLNLGETTSHTKFIPNEYKYNSIHIRKRIIQGLFDTDGSNVRGKYIEYTTTSEQLAKDVIEICQSLGYICNIKSRFTKCNNKKFKSFRILIKGNNISELFNLPRKKYGKRIKNKIFRTIKDVEYVGNKECVCILLDDEDHLYLTNSYIITHNTITALQIAANAQEQYDKPVYIGNVEYRINDKELSGIHNLNVDKVEMIQSTEGKILVAQDFLQEFTNIIKSVPGCVLVIDSSSALCAEGEFTSEIKAAGRNDGPKLLAQFCRKMTGVVPVQKTIVIVIQHLIANTSGYGEAYYEDGGRKMQHQADLKLRCTTFQKWEHKEEQIGQTATWHVKTSALSKPGAKFQSYIRYGYGIDDIYELMTLGKDMGIIEKKGSWYVYGDLKVQGEEPIREALLNDKPMLEKLKTDINNML